jgi:hypothetical protein
MTDPAGEMTTGLAHSWWMRPAVFGAVILVASLLPLPRDDAVPPLVPFGIDTWVHVISYAVFAASLLGATRVEKPHDSGALSEETGSPGARAEKPRRSGTRAEEPRGSGRRAIVIAATVAVALGVGIEVVQTVIPGRTFEVGDIVANAVGVLLGLVVAD